MLFFATPLSRNKEVKKVQLPEWIHNRHRSFKISFDRPQNANVLWAFITGQKNGISPAAKADFKVMELGYLFSPSSIHLTALLGLLFWSIKKIRHKLTRKCLNFILLSAVYFVPYLTIKRIVIMRLLLLLKNHFPRKIPFEYVFFATFILSYLLGHFKESPLGFAYSFLFMGTFITLRDYSRITIILGLFSTHLLICFFNGSETSIVSLALNIPLIALFSFIMPLGYVYFLTFSWIDYNWIEAIIRSYIVLVHWLAKISAGASLHASLPLILAIWFILLKRQQRYVMLLMLLHTNLANSPAIFRS